MAFAYWVQDADPDVSIFWVHASNAQRFREAYTLIAEKLNVPGIDDPRANILLLVKKWLEAQNQPRWLMIVDNADDDELFFPPERMEVDSATEAQLVCEDDKLAHYLPDSCFGGLLFTTRNKQAAVDLCQGDNPIEVPSMTASEAHQLVKAILPGEISVAETFALSSRLEHLPLALAQAASYIQKSSITIPNYINHLDEGDSALVDQLSKPFETVGRDSRAPHAVAATWAISLEQIERNNELASDILSFLGVLHNQAIPKTLIEKYYRLLYIAESESIASSALLNALDLLKGFSFISEGTSQDINMPRLVQLVIQKWLTAKNRMAKYVQLALVVVSANLPTENYLTFLQYLPHASSVLGRGTYIDENDYIVRELLVHRITEYLTINGHYNQAGLRELRERHLDMTQTYFGRVNENTAYQMWHLSRIYHLQQKLKEAEDLNKEALELQRVC